MDEGVFPGPVPTQDGTEPARQSIEGYMRKSNFILVLKLEVNALQHQIHPLLRFLNMNQINGIEGKNKTQGDFRVLKKQEPSG